MAKELTKIEVLKKQYSKLYNLNQRLKNISSCYYISHAGYVYLKSLNKFSEVIIELRYPETIDFFNGAMILPNAFFDFGKNAKKTKLTIEEITKDNTGVKLGQVDDPELNYFINIVNPDYKADEEYTKKIIIPEMYKRFFDLSNPDLYNQYPVEDAPYIKISDEDYIDMLVNAKEKVIPYNNTVLIFTKQLFADGKKDDSLEFRKLCFQSLKDSLYRVFYILKHECDIYTSYTIFSVPQSI